MKDVARRLPFVYSLMIVFLMITGILCYFHKETFQWQQRGDFENASAAYVPAGDYVLYVAYDNDIPGNAISVVSERGINRELAREEMKQGKGEVSISLTVLQGEYGLRLTTDMDEAKSLRVIDMQSVHLLYRDGLYLCVLCFALAVILFLMGIGKIRRISAVTLVLIGMGVLSSVPLFSDYIIRIHLQDLQFHLTRIQGLYQGLAAGEFPVRINGIQTDGYGNLSATMYPQLFLYFPAVLRLLGVSLMLSYKTLLVTINIFTAVISYCSVKGITKSHQMGLVAALLYTFSPYRLSNLYFRAALGESLAMVFLPVIIWGMYEVLWGNKKRWPILLLGMTGLLQSHVLTVEMCVLFMVPECIFFLVSRKGTEKIQRILEICKAAIVTVLLNASMLVPFLYFFTQDLQAFHMPNKVSDSVVYFSQMFTLFQKPQGYSMEPGTVCGEMPLSVGLVLLLTTFLYLAYELVSKEDAEGVKGVARHCLVYGLTALLLASWIVPWEQLEEIAALKTFTASLQFTWRFFAIASVLLCIVGAIGLVSFVNQLQKNWIYGILICLVFTSAFFYFDMLTQDADQVSNKLELESTVEADSIYMYSESEEFQDLRMNYDRDEAVFLTDFGPITECRVYERKGSGIRAELEMEDAGELSLPIYYFPGYEIKVNGRVVDNYAKDALLTCIVPMGSVTLQMRYVGLLGFRIGDAVTLLTMLGFIGCMVRKAVINRKHH